jgi:hypothetical protein
MRDDPWDATTVTPVGDGCYTATIGPEWVLAMAPQGGVVTAIAARAMEAELAAVSAGTAVPPLRSFQCVFAAPVPAGPVRVEVRVLRLGRSMSQLIATVTGDGRDAGLTALAVFGGARAGFTFTDLAMPDVPDVEECPSFRDPPPPEAGIEDWVPMPFWTEVLEGRPALGQPPWDPSPRGAAEQAVWYRFEQPPIAADGGLDPYAAFVMADVMPGAVFQKIGMTEDRWFSPSADFTIHLFGRATPGWILGHNRARHAGDGYASVDMALWDPRAEGGPALVAYATQQCFFTRWDPPPPAG